MFDKNQQKPTTINIKNTHTSRLEPSHVPVRNVTNKSRDNVRGFYSSDKNKCSVACESLLELEACNLFEFSSLVASYKEQPVKIAYFYKDKWRSYTPDFELRLTDGRTIYVEVKPVKKLENPQLVDLYAYLAAIIKQDNKDFYILTDVEIRPPFLQSNYKFLKYAKRKPITYQEIEFVKDWMISQEEVTFGGLSYFVGCATKSASFIGHGLLETDLSAPISLTSPIVIKKENSHEKAPFIRRFAPTFQAK
jgi:hypothetical protein